VNLCSCYNSVIYSLRMLTDRYMVRKDTMIRLDFHSVSTILMDNQKNTDISQIDFMYQLFAAFMNDESTNFDFDNGLVCHWLKGEVRVSPKIINYYIPKAHHQLMYNDMINEVFPFISDPASVTLAIKELLIADVSISETERERLLGFLSADTSECYAAFIAETLIFGMSRCFVNAGNGAKNSSPLIDDIILTTNLPTPARTFVAREAELTDIEELLSANRLVFLTGIPGIGKSEVAKAYMKAQKKYYTNILYLEYIGSFYEMIADLDFVDDTDGLSEKERFRKHFRFLKTLKADTLIVIDNFNTTATEESLLNQISSLKCTILITTRNHFALGTEYAIESSKELALQVLQQNVKTSALDIIHTYSNEIELLLETINYHIMSAGLIGRLLSYKNMLPADLAKHLHDNVLLPDNQNKLSISKDNVTVKSEYQNIMQDLLQYGALAPALQQTLSIIALAPETGFPLRYLSKWHHDCTNEVDELEELGLLELNHHSATLNPYIRKLVNAGKHLAISSCNELWKNLLAECQDVDSGTATLALQIIDTALRFALKDDKQLWLSVIRTSLESNHCLHRYRSYSNLLNEYEYLCLDHSICATDDQYLLFHFKAIEVAEIHTNVNKAIQFEEKAIAIAGKNGTSQVLNFSTLYLDIGRYYHIQGNLGKALDYTKKSTGILQETQMQYSPNGIASLVQYARYLFENRQINETIRIYQNCLDIINVCFGDTSLTYGYIAQNLAAILASVNKSKAALIYYDKAIIALENLLGSEHEDVMLCKEQMHKLLATTTPVLLSAPALPMKITA
jgi:tetratricopeptide (TPR) repeat protein